MVTPRNTDEDVYTGAGPWPVRAVRRLEGATGLDGVVRLLGPAATALAGSRRLGPLLRGDWMGHAVHPVAVMAPLGLFGSATVVDVVGGDGSESVARTLTLAGLLTLSPAVLTGLTEWAATEPRESRVGVVHAATNTLAASLFLASYLARRRHHGVGVGLGVVGNLVAGVGGHLGGHLAAVRHVDSRHPSFDEEDRPRV
ncbi:DUF2231 domain-containing protein [Nakamurella sp. A5-74]|uniref:DUF2231 domain-containing protein n=1 Tax=Nakamurella sp. A5-74 TaxID=3158264 RepID=A0AAU8DMZ0_9ACTN